MTTFINPKSKLFQHMPTLALIQKGERPAPVNVEIDLSNRCSLGCSWCHFAYTHTKGPLAGKVQGPENAISGGDLMDKQLAVNVLEQLHEAGVRSITWTGGGEPTLHPNFDDIIVKASFCLLEQGMYTHGGHIDKSRASLIKSAFTWVFVSLDECTADTYKAGKGVNRFEAACTGIRNLVAAEGKATVGVGFLIHEGNWKDIHAMVRLGRELGADYVQFRPTVHFEQNEPGKLQESDTTWIRHAMGRLNAYKHDAFVIADQDRFHQYANWRGHGYKTCNWSALQTVITPNGKVWRCTNKREHPDALLGDLSVESFETMWARSGGPCAVDGACRVLCRGHISNQVLDGVMTEMPHANFI
jgi:MoaA/NifB/PqqE/SkfB family radical SAM enzyme